MTDDLIPAPDWLTPAVEDDPWRGVTVDPQTPFREWAAYVAAVLRFARGLQWLIGDLLDQGEQLYGEAYSQVLGACDYEAETVRACGWVARRIPPVRRRTELSWSHHREVAALDAPAADALLDRAAREGLSSRELRHLARPKPPLPAPPSSKADAADFDLWLQSWCRRGSPHELATGFPVVLAPMLCSVTLTAEQALRLGERLCRLAETEKE